MESLLLKGWIMRIVAGLAALEGAAIGQVTTPSKPPLSFEVASVKPVGPLDHRALSSGMVPGMSIDNDRVYIGSISLMELVSQAYEVSRNRVAGGPTWLSRLDAERFGVVAKFPDGATRDQVPEMLQALLATRFQLVAHREKRDISAYALVVSKGGPRLQEAAPDAPAPAISGEGSGTAQASQPAVGDAAPSKPASAKGGEWSFDDGGERGTASRTAGGAVFNSAGLRREVSDNGRIRFEYNSLTMERFASLLGRYLDRPVVDQTRLKGKYQVSYEIDFKAVAMALINSDFMNVGKPGVNPAEMGDPIPDPGEAISSSVKKLGLKLDPRVLPCDVLVIDHIEKTPTEN
jgi:uncharacterized protein (TIGR03435 family)